MFLFKSLGSRHSLTLFLPSEVSFTLQTIELTQSVGSVTSVIMPSAIILSHSALYNGKMWTGTVRGGWTTGLGLSISWMWYLSPGNLPILSKNPGIFLTQWILKDSSPRHLDVLGSTLRGAGLLDVYSYDTKFLCELAVDYGWVAMGLDYIETRGSWIAFKGYLESGSA